VRTGPAGTDHLEVEASVCWAAGPEVPAATLRLDEPFPNPFNPAVRITFHLARPGPVDAAVWDLRGRRIATLLAAETAAGEHQLTWRGEGPDGPAPAGTYLVSVATPDRRVTRKIALVR
jgi:hypothetical protein